MKLTDDWNYRFNLNYREQRGNYLGHANKIIATGFDMPLDKKFSIGEFVINNKSINGTINSLNVMLSGSYKIIHNAANKHERHNMSVGLQVGFMQKSFNSGDFVYDSQYAATSNVGFDTNLPTGENFIKQNSSNFDINMGMYYHFIDKNKKYSPYGGFSIYHLSQPNQSFSNIYSQTPMRFTLHGGCLYTINDEFSILPQFLYMNQAHANELNIGIIAYDKIRCTNYQPMMGVSYRKGNAVIIHLGLKYKTYNVRVSYDINTNYLKQYGNRGLELSIIFTPKKIIKDPEMVATLVIVNDSLAITKDSLKTLLNPLPPIKDSTKNIVAKTINKPAILLNSNTIATLPHKQIAPVAPVGVDSVKIFVPNISATTDTKISVDEKEKKFEPIVSTVVNKSLPKVAINFLTTTTAKSYRVQLGAFRYEVPVEIEKKLIEVNAQKIVNPKNPKIPTIYTIGNFKTHDEAIGLKDEMIKKGFEGAFIIDIPTGTVIEPMQSTTTKSINDNNKTSEMNNLPERLSTKQLEAIPTMPQSTIKFSMNPTTTTETESFRIQLGAFKEEVPLDIANRLLKVNAERIENMTDSNGNTIYTVGNYKTHDEAISLKNKMIEEGFTDAFIVKVSAGSLVAPIK
jgi:type IX secretion system PorP/SprF family membrane protein